MARSFSRLQKLEERRNLIRAVWLILGSVALVALTITLGFNILTKIFLFLGNVNSTNKPVVNTDVIPPGPPTFFTSFEATNSAVITLSGYAEPGATVYLTQNTQAKGNVVSTQDGVFQFPGIKLNPGLNSFSAVAMDAAGNRSQPSVTVEITFSDKGPDLKITVPTDKQIISGGDGTIRITGSTDPDARLTVNDRVVIVSPSGNFNYSLVLNQGDNNLVITATDTTGNQTQKSLTVTYNP